MNGIFTASELPCYRKRGFVSREWAAQSLAQMELRDPSAIGILNIYWCLHCGGYHIGNYHENSEQKKSG